VGARKNLELAITAAKLIGKPANTEWGKVKEKMYVPYSVLGEYYPEYEGARAWERHIGHVTPLMNYPFEFPVTEGAKRNTLENAFKSILSTGGGAYLLPTIYPLVAAELGDQKLVDQTHTHSFEPFLKPPFNVLNEGTRGESVNFITGTGFLQQFVYGYTGLRLSEEGVSARFKPILPSTIKKLLVRNAIIRGSKYDLIVEGGKLDRIPKLCQ
jgi:hypothetical protein